MGIMPPAGTDGAWYAVVNIEFEEEVSIKVAVPGCVATVACKEQLVQWFDGKEDRVSTWDYRGVELQPREDVEAALNGVGARHPELRSLRWKLKQESVVSASLCESFGTVSVQVAKLLKRKNCKLVRLELYGFVESSHLSKWWRKLLTPSRMLSWAA